MSLAIFDLDNTLLGGDSDHAWGEFVVEQGIVDADHYKTMNDAFYQQYQQGALDISAYLDFALQPLAGRSKAELAPLHQQFMREKIEPMRLAKAEQLLAEHRSRGDYLLIITATNSFITEPIADSLAVDDILATRAELVDGVYTGKACGTPCYQEGKVIRLREWLSRTQMSLAGSHFYRDSHNDLPLLKLVDVPVAVDADETLSAYAKNHQWQHISLRG